MLFRVRLDMSYFDAVVVTGSDQVDGERRLVEPQAGSGQRVRLADFCRVRIQNGVDVSIIGVG